MNTQLKQEIEDLKTKLAKLEGQLPAPQPKMIQLPDRAYSVGKYPVTVGEYNTFQASKEGSSQLPVTEVNWHEANAYCRWLTKLTGVVYRLPTEDEFEHFCGDHVVGNPETAVYDSDGCLFVGTKQPNRYGLHDVLGLVWEWQSSKFDNSSARRVARGGSWLNPLAFARLSARLNYDPDLHNYVLGFRVVCTNEPPTN
jgi:formylglycine-generating enzyme required for sulfatase activity